MRAALVITPGDDELAVAEIGHRRLVLGAAVRISIDQEVVADLGTGGIKPLAEYVYAITAIVVGTLVVAPGHHIAAVRKRGNRRIVLAAPGMGVDQNLDRRNNRCVDRIATRVLNAHDLGKDVVAGAAA